MAGVTAATFGAAPILIGSVLGSTVIVSGSTAAAYLGGTAVIAGGIGAFSSLANVATGAVGYNLALEKLDNSERINRVVSGTIGTVLNATNIYLGAGMYSTNINRESLTEGYSYNRKNIQVNDSEVNVDNIYEKANSKILRKNMIEAGYEVPSYKNVAHHIVAGGAEKVEQARNILYKFNISINDASNGVFLPIEKDISSAIYHPIIHTNVYYDNVTELLIKAKSSEEAIEILRYIAEQISNGTFKY